MEFAYREIELVPSAPFRIATRRVGGGRFRNVVVTVRDGEGRRGEGEGHPALYYGETSEIALAALDLLRRELPATDLAALGPERIGEIMAAADRLLAENRAAKAALEGALWDLCGRQRERSVRDLLGLEPQDGVDTSLTVGLAEPEEMRARAREAVGRGFGTLKIKAGWDGDVDTIERIRLETGARVYVDVNGAWSAGEALPKLERLAMAGVELVEQPLAADDLAGYRAIAARAPLPIVLDESVRRPLDLDVFGEYADGVNLKISKLGGIGPCLAVAERARMMKLDLMLGCMIESSLGISQALQIAGPVRWADLDGSLLLAHDPYTGPTCDKGRLAAPDGPGLGAQRRDA